MEELNERKRQARAALRLDLPPEKETLLEGNRAARAIYDGILTEEPEDPEALLARAFFLLLEEGDGEERCAAADRMTRAVSAFFDAGQEKVWDALPEEEREDLICLAGDMARLAGIYCHRTLRDTVADSLRTIGELPSVLMDAMGRPLALKASQLWAGEAFSVDRLCGEVSLCMQRRLEEKGPTPRTLAAFQAVTEEFLRELIGTPPFFPGDDGPGEARKMLNDRYEALEKWIPAYFGTLPQPDYFEWPGGSGQALAGLGREMLTEAYRSSLFRQDVETINARAARRKRESRTAAYWAERPEEKAALETERAALAAERPELEQEIRLRKEQVRQAQEARDGVIRPRKNALAERKKELGRLKAEMDRLGLLQGGKKKKLRVQIGEMEEQCRTEEEALRALTKEQEEACDQAVSGPKWEIFRAKARLDEVERRMAAIADRLEMPEE